MTNGMWSKLSPLLPAEAGRQGPVAKDNRLMVEGMLWRIRTGCPWRDLPSEFGPWESVYTRFSRWCKAGIWRRVLSTLQEDEADCDWLFIDSSSVKVHQHAHGAKKNTPKRSGNW
jgi:putative transposase